MFFFSCFPVLYIVTQSFRFILSPLGVSLESSLGTIVAFCTAKGIPPTTECNNDRIGTLLDAHCETKQEEKQFSVSPPSAVSFVLVFPKQTSTISVCYWAASDSGRELGEWQTDTHTQRQKTDTQRTHRHTVKHKHLNSLIACGEMGTGGCISPIFATQQK